MNEAFFQAAGGFDLRAPVPKVIERAGYYPHRQEKIHYVAPHRMFFGLRDAGRVSPIHHGGVQSLSGSVPAPARKEQNACGSDQQCDYGLFHRAFRNTLMWIGGRETRKKTPLVVNS